MRERWTIIIKGAEEEKSSSKVWCQNDTVYLLLPYYWGKKGRRGDKKSSLHTIGRGLSPDFRQQNKEYIYIIKNNKQIIKNESYIYIYIVNQQDNNNNKQQQQKYNKQTKFVQKNILGLEISTAL